MLKSTQAWLETRQQGKLTRKAETDVIQKLVEYAKEQGSTHADMLYMLVLYTAAGAILGHNYPFYLGFKGGKGIASTAGLILSMPPVFILVGVIVFFGTFLTTHYVSLGSLLVYLFLVIQLIYCGQTGFFEGMTQPALFEMYAVALFLMAMAYWRHRSNIQKLVTGTERKTYLFKKNKVD